MHDPNDALNEEECHTEENREKRLPGGRRREEGLIRAGSKRDTGITLEWQEAGRVTDAKETRPRLSASLLASVSSWHRRRSKEAGVLSALARRTCLRSKFDRHRRGVE